MPYGSLCPAGTYMPDDVTGAESIDKCKDCPPKKFCVGGRIAGECAPGYVCRKGAKSPTPTGDVGSGAYPCPVGFYCPSGTDEELRCKSGLYTY